MDKEKWRLIEDTDYAIKDSNMFHDISSCLDSEDRESLYDYDVRKDSMININFSNGYMLYNRMKKENENTYVSIRIFKMKIGKFLKNNVGINYTQSQIDKIIGVTCIGGVEYSIVKGEDVKKYYLEDNYDVGSGNLNSSCMRFYSCQEYLDVYTQEDIVSLLIGKRKGCDKITTRALLWEVKEYGTEKSFKHIDRIYGQNIRDEETLEYAKNLGYEPIGDTEKNLYAKIKLTDEDYFPYIDNMLHLVRDDNYEFLLTNFYPDRDMNDLYHICELRNQHGGTAQSCAICGDYIDGEVCVHGNDTYCEYCYNEEFTYVESKGECYHNDDVEFCTICDCYELSSDVYSIEDSYSVVCQSCHSTDVIKLGDGRHILYDEKIGSYRII